MKKENLPIMQVYSNEKEFFVGFKTYYEAQDGHGIYNALQNTNLVYKSSDYLEEFGFYAQFIEPTTKVESNGSFICLNTYDKAYFTFGFMQFAIHVPNGDFVNFFKKLLLFENAENYFPRLRLINDRIFYISDNGTKNELESENSTKPLMEYFNPSLKEVENQELICAARMVHWATNDLEHRKLQVSESINLYKNNMKKYHKRFGLDSFPAKICFMICDILHHGRGKYDRIANAINTNGNYEKAFLNLCSIGEVNYSTRINTLKKILNEQEKKEIFNKKYDAKTNSFI